MKLSSKRALIAAALATAFVGVSATAIAQGMGAMPGMSHGQHQQHMNAGPAAAAPGAPAAMDKSQMTQRHAQYRAQRMERMEKMRAEHQARLKAELKLTPTQEPAWLAYVARTGPQARPATPAPAEDWSKLTTPQRLDKMQALHNERQGEMAQRIDATKSFYAALTPEQQKVFDTQAHGSMQRTGMKGGHGSNHGGHHGMHHGEGQPGAGMPGGKMGGMMGGMGCEAMGKPQG